MEIIQTKEAPLKNTSHAVRAGNFVFVSGQIGMEYSTGTLKGVNVEDEVHQAFLNVQEILRAASLTLKHIVKVEIRVAEMRMLRDVDKVYGKIFTDHVPARDVYQVAMLHKNAKVEVSVTAYAGK